MFCLGLRRTPLALFLFLFLVLPSEKSRAADRIFIDVDSSIYGVDQSTVNTGGGDISLYYKPPIVLYDSTGQTIPLESVSTENKQKIIATLKALDDINFKTYSDYERNFDLGVEAGLYAATDLIETIGTDSLGLVDEALRGFVTCPIDPGCIAGIQGLIFDVLLESSNASAHLAGIRALVLQKVALDYAKNIAIDATIDTINYADVRNAYYALKLSQYSGTAAQTIFTLVRDSATVTDVDLLKDLTQANMSSIPVVGGVLGATWSVFDNARDATELFWNLVFALEPIFSSIVNSYVNNIYTTPNDLLPTPIDTAFDDRPNNTPPAATFILNQSIAEIGDTITVDGTVSSDSDGDSLSFFWVIIDPQGNKVDLSYATLPEISFQIEKSGIYIVNLSLSDGRDTVSLEGTVIASSQEIQSPNNEPVAVIQSSHTTIQVGNTVTLDGSSSYDLDGDQVSGSYSWFLHKPGGSSATLSSTSGAIVSFNPDMAGTYTAVLGISDGIANARSTKKIVATESYPTIEVDIEDDGNKHIYIWGVDVGECQFKSVGSFTVPAGEKWRYIKIAGSKEDIILVARWGTPPEPRDSDWYSKCRAGYNIDDRFRGFEFNFRESTSVITYDSGDRQSGEVLYIYAYSPDGQEGGGVSSYSVNSIVRVSYDLDGDGVPDYEEDSACLNNSSDSFDSDGDGICDNEDKFDNDPAASIDTDDDGYPDFWNTGKTADDSITGLTLDHVNFLSDPNEWADSDSDGIGDNSDQFYLDPAASIDTDNDGSPDVWNTGMSSSDSIQGLYLDKFPTDPSASVDSDDDGFPDYWNLGKTADDSVLNLKLDRFPADSSEWMDTDNDGFGDNNDWDPDNPFEWRDSDGDGVGDNSDIAPNDPGRWLNSSPVIEADLTGLQFYTGDSENVPLQIIDDDGDSLTTILIYAPDFAILSGNNLILSPQVDDIGEYVFFVKVADPYGGNTAKQVNVNILAKAVIGAPVIKTVSVNVIGENEAELSATINPNGNSTTLYFDYGLDTSYGSSTSAISVGSGTSDVSKSKSVTGLACDTTYHYRARAVNSAGTQYGGDKIFTTVCIPDGPLVETVEVDSVSFTTAVLSATVNPQGSFTELYFDYGTDTSFGSSTTAIAVGSGNSNLPKTQSISGLECGTEYHYRARAENAGGISYGASVTFTTNDCLGDTKKYGVFHRTAGWYSEVDDNNQACINEFGDNARLADWDDIVSFYDEGGDMQAFFTGLGMGAPGTDTAVSLNVSNGGEEIYSGSRHYFIARHDHNKPSYFASHGQIDNHLIDLGSWNGRRPALCVVEQPVVATAAFSSDRAGNGTYDLWSLDSEGSYTQLTNTSSTDEYRPIWSPDGTKIAYQNHDSATNTNELRVINADGTGSVVLAQGKIAPLSWTPDGEAILYRNTLSNCSNEVRKVSLDGTDLGLFLNPQVYGHKVLSSIHFHPDGNKLTFASQQSGCWSPTYQIFVADYNAGSIDTNSITQITNDPSSLGSVQYSPDGTRLVYQRSDNPQGYSAPQNIYLIDDDGGNKVKLTDYTGSGKPFSPKWSNDGNKIYFGLPDVGSDYKLMVMDRDGSNITEFINSANSDRDIDFRPVSAVIQDPDADSDNDGMPDVFETEYGLNPYVDDADSDLDGDYLTNFAEYFLGTNPNDTDSDKDGIDDFFEYEFELDLTVQDGHLDLDEDGLTNLEEYQLFTFPNDPDTDGDQMPDGWEVRYGLNPYGFDASGDLDGDGVSNLDEYITGTNPKLDNKVLNLVIPILMNQVLQ